MSYVIYHKDTTEIYEVRKRGQLYGKRTYETQGAVKAAITREAMKGNINREDYDWADTGFYKDNIEKMVTKTFIAPGTGKECTVTQSVNTPLCCDPSSETYWSM